MENFFRAYIHIVLSQKNAERKKKCIAIAEMKENINILINLNRVENPHFAKSIHQREETCEETINNKLLVVQWIAITHIHADSKAAEEISN